MKRKRYNFTDDQKQAAVDEYVSGRRRAEDIAKSLGVPQGYLYKWRVQLEERVKGARAEELESMGHSKHDAERIQALEAELEEYKKKLAEQVMINDLLKKLRAQGIYPHESELIGLIKTTKNLNQKKKPLK